MRDLLVSGLGFLIIGVTVVDAFWTVVWSSGGGGPITGLVTGVVRRASRPVGDRSRRYLSIAGPVALLVIVVLWALLILIGFTLAMQFDPDAIRSSATDVPASAGERVYFVGYTLFTLGPGDFLPTSGGTRAVTVLANAIGMFLITLSVTYLLPVVSASVKSRSFGTSVLSLGRTPEAVVVGTWNGSRVDLETQLRRLASELGMLAHQHLAYPVLHLFHSGDPLSSAPLAVVVCDDVLTLLDAVAPEAAPPSHVRRQLRSSIDLYVDTFGPHVTDSRPGPAPSLEALVEAGIPLALDRTGFDERLTELAHHRGRMHSLAAAAGMGSERRPDEGAADEG